MSPLPKTKLTIELSHETLKALTKIYAQTILSLSRVETEKTISGRRIDIVGRKLISSTRKREFVFIEIERHRLTSNYIDKFLEFCESNKAFEAYIVAPEIVSETRHFKHEDYAYMRTLSIIPIKEIFDGVSREYRIDFEIIDGKLVLGLNPT